MKRDLLSVWFTLAVSVGVALRPTPASGVEQTLTLHGGWNLISLWVQPTTATLPEVFAELPAGRLQRVFTFDRGLGADDGVWTRYTAPQQSGGTWLNTLTEIEPSVGYWVLLAPGQPVELHIAGSLAVQQPRLLSAGWHLVGMNNTESRLWHDLLGPAASSVGAVFAYDPVASEFIGFSDATFDAIDVNGDGDIGETEYGWRYAQENGALRRLEPGTSYWIHLDQAFAIGPVLEVEMQSDMDGLTGPNATTNAWNPYGEDTDINGNGILDYGYTIPGAWDDYGNAIVNTQDTIWFRVPRHAPNPLPVTRQHLRILNRGTGALLFDIQSAVPGLSLSTSSGQVMPGDQGVTVALAIDFQGLVEGEFSETVTILSNGGSKAIEVKVTVPGIGGEYSGSAVIQSISQFGTNKKAFLGRRPLQIRFTETGAVLLAAGSLHYDEDVVLTGPVGNGQFNVSGEMAVPAGSPGNPYGVSFSRWIEISGGWATGQDTTGAHLGLSGEFQETVYDLLPGFPVVLHGEVSLVPSRH